MYDLSLISKSIVVWFRELRLLLFCADNGHSQGVQIIGLELADVLPVERRRGDQEGHGLLGAYFPAVAHFGRIGVKEIYMCVGLSFSTPIAYIL
jgi:hypothetical protein